RRGCDGYCRTRRRFAGKTCGDGSHCCRNTCGNGASTLFFSRRSDTSPMASFTSFARHDSAARDEDVRTAVYMRAFIAIELPDEIRQKLAAVQRDLKTVTNSARWVAPESIHLTLRFIGETPDHRIGEIDSALLSLTWI